MREGEGAGGMHLDTCPPPPAAPQCTTTDALPAPSAQAMLKFLGPPPQGFEHVPHHTFMGSPEYLGEAGAGAGAGVEAGAGADPARRPSEAQECEGGGAGRAGWRLDDFDPYERGEAGCVPLLRGDFYKLINVAVYENAVGSRSRVGVLAGGRVRFGVLEGRG